jgi:branched-chain amino acid transport system ATP-binding protein
VRRPLGVDFGLVWAGGAGVTVLEVTGLRKAFGGVRALAGVDMTLRGGEITGIVGPNGAGKSTLVNVASGLNRADSGSIVLDGQDVSRLSLNARARRGIVRTFQHPHYFGPLSVGEVVRVGLLSPSTRRHGVSEESVLERFGLAPLMGVAVDRLPYGTKKLVNVAFAWALRPRVLFLDEPFAGVGEEYAGVFTAAVRFLADDGVAVGLIEHNIDIVFGLSDQIVVLDAGAVIFFGSPSEATRDRGVAEAFFGRRLASTESE